MNKVLIRTRQIDNNKQLQILIKDNDDLSDFNEYSNVSKNSQILSGMDKGEESEHHLQEVLRELQYEKTTANSAIPIPDVHEEYEYDSLYQTDFTLPKNYIRLKTLEFEDELPEYDLDEDDQEWLNNSKLEITSIKFESVVEEFERACNQKALLLDEAKSLLRHEPVKIVTKIYDYWLTKRVKTGQPLLLSVKAEKAERCNNTPIDPYIAFRKRSEKMTTRKNRRVDESSYEKMYRLKSHMDKLSQIIDFVLKRESTKSQITQIGREIFIKRFKSRDYEKLHWKDSETTLKNQSIKLVDNFKSAQRSREENHKEARRKRPFSKTIDTTHNSGEKFSDEFDFSFKPMAKCKYLPSKLSTLDHQNQLHNDTDPRSFSMLKLSHLPAPLNSLNTPVRIRSNINGNISIDLKNSHTSPYLRPTQSNYTSSSSYNDVRQRILNSSMLQGVNSSSNIMTKLYTLYTRDINCGLRPLYHNPNNENQNQSSQNSLTSLINVPVISTPSHKPNNIISKYNDTEDYSTKSNSVNSKKSEFNNGTKSSINHNFVTEEPNKYPSFPSQANNISSHHNGKLCTYQNPSQNLDHNKNHAFIDCERRQINGQKRSPTAIKDMVDCFSLNGGFSSKLSQVVGLNCLKSLTNKRLIPRDNIDEISVNFYSKSNGHQKKWLKQNTADNCLKPPTLSPHMWKSEPAHVMTSVNKMT